MLFLPIVSRKNIGYTNLASRMPDLITRLWMNYHATAKIVIRVRRANLLVANGRGGFRAVIDQDHAHPHQAERSH